MTILVRRSNLLVRVADADAAKSAWRHNADPITLDLEGADAVARSRVKDAIPTAAQGAAEVFVKIGPENLRANLEAAVWPGLRGLMLSGVKSAADVKAADESVTALERARSLPKNSLQLIVVIGSAAGVWDVRAVVTASARISQVVLDEQAFPKELDI